MAEFFRRLICVIFGECWRVDESLRRLNTIEMRVDKLERDVRREAGSNWRPSDAFRIR